MAINHNVQEVRRDLVPAGTWGNLTQARGSYTTAAMAQNEKAALVKVPANCVITDVKVIHAALGAGSGFTIGFEAKDGSPSAAAAFATVADSSSAGSANPIFAPYAVSEEGYVTLTNPNAATLTGLVQVVVQYEYTNA